ncbi:YdcF family protein [Sphingomonas sp. SUN039]|uniref:YdcF family protein n=1 Tax=Sphingomonas sp. SUN039 TaxID=2937787 RepID=UPI0021642ADC|nr:YdcF family protein [Sphingomonas sp. SUN039]UVO55926.1 YdcF family protein [Sphingomonas sp. SUN039]
MLGFVAYAVFLPRAADAAIKTDVIVVPTGGVGRTVRGAAILKAGGARRMFISGVAATTRARDIAAENHLDPHLFDCCVDLGREASDTRSNAEETAAWLAGRKAKSVRLVTTDWHMARARFELDRVLPADIRVIDDAVDSEAGFGVLMREYNKYLLRRVAVLAGW